MPVRECFLKSERIVGHAVTDRPIVFDIDFFDVADQLLEFIRQPSEPAGPDFILFTDERFRQRKDVFIPIRQKER